MINYSGRIKPVFVYAGMLIFSFLLIFANGCRNNSRKLVEYLDAAHELWGFNGAVLVAYEGKIVFSQGYGFADQEFQEPNTTQTRFFIGSITKQFTAAAILSLRDQRLLNINDPINRYLPDYPSEVAEEVTIRDLLSHTSGIPDYTRNLAVLLHRTGYMSPEELVSVFRKEPLEFEPGEKFRYSNSNYILLGQIIENVAGQSYEAYLNRYILNPAGMTNSGYARREAGIPDRAEGYTIEDKELEVNALPIDFSILHSAGAMYSTVEDIYLWDNALYTEKVLSRNSIAEMLTPNEFGHGYGWFIDSLYGRRHAYHGGFLDGFNSIYDRWPDDKICIVIFSNEDEAPVGKMARGIAAILFDRPYAMPVRKRPAPFDTSSLGDYEGVYHVGEDYYRFISSEHDTLFTHLRGQRRKTLYQQSPDTFFFASDNTRLLVFDRNEDNKVTGCRVIDEGREWYAGKISKSEAAGIMFDRIEIELDHEIMKRYRGVYEMESQFGRADQAFLISIDIGRGFLRASITGSEYIRLYPSSKTDFFLKDGDFRLSFIVDDNQNVIGCTVLMGGIRVHGIKIQ